MSNKTIAILAGVILTMAAMLLAMGIAALCVVVGLVDANRGGAVIVALITGFVGFYAARMVAADIRGDR